MKNTDPKYRLFISTNGHSTAAWLAKVKEHNGTEEAEIIFKFDRKLSQNELDEICLLIKKANQ